MRIVPAVVISIFCTHAVVAEKSVPSDTAMPLYRMLGTGFLGGHSALQQSLDEAAKDGYRIVGVFDLSRVLVRKADNDERFAYRVIGSDQTKSARAHARSLEREMNTAAAAGFRVVLDAISGAPWLLIMEKRLGTTSVGRVDYKLASFSEMYRGDDDSYDTAAIDELFAEMAVGGYEVIGLTGPHIVVFERDTGVPAAQTVRDAARSYHAVIASTQAEFEAGLNRAARAGYRLHATAMTAFPILFAVVVRDATAARRTYAAFAPRRLAGLTEELSQAAVAGWMVHPRGVLNSSCPLDCAAGSRSRTSRLLFILERHGTSTPARMLVLDAFRSSTLASKLNEPAAARFVIVAAGASYGLMVTVLRPAS